MLPQIVEYYHNKVKEPSKCPLKSREKNYWKYMNQFEIR